MRDPPHASSSHGGRRRPHYRRWRDGIRREAEKGASSPWKVTAARMLRSGEGFGGEKLQIGGGVQKRNGSTDRLQCPSVAHIHSRVVGPTGCKPRPSQKPAQIVDSADRKADNEVYVFASRVCPSLISNSPKKKVSYLQRSEAEHDGRHDPRRHGRGESRMCGPQASGATAS
uniref:Uncharacterized protein n=1 Tax=Triticum urartu TaxID=4572 RepID=A0A8R7UJY8_TRIUA